MVGGIESAFFSKAAEDFGGEFRLGVAKAEEFKEVVDTGVCGEKWGCGGEVAIDGKPERATYGGYAADDVGTVDSGSIPSICGNVDSFDSDFSVAKTLGGSDSDCFVEEAEEAFDRDGLVIVA